MDVDENSRSETIFDILNSFHTKRSGASASCSSTNGISLDLSIPTTAFRPQLHQLDFVEFISNNATGHHAASIVDESSINSRKSSRKQGKDGICVQLPNTGRFVYTTTTENISDIYRALGKEVNPIQKQSKSGGDKDFDSDSLRKLNDMTLAAKEAESSSSVTLSGTSKVSDPASVAKFQQGKNAVLDKSSGRNNESHGFSSSRPSNKGTISAAKSSVHAGRAAAMARMAAMGEDWPEEEELPGISRPSPTAINSSTGGLSRDANKQLNDAMQRQKKVVTAKRKG